MEAPKVSQTTPKKLDACLHVLFFSRKKEGDSAIAYSSEGTIISPPSLTSIELDQALGINQLVYISLSCFCRKEMF